MMYNNACRNGVINMRKENTSTRLKKIMTDRNLRQVDILELCKPYCQKYNVKLGRNDLSQYVTGKVEPGQKKLTILGMALNVSEAWLMGFEVPQARSGQITDEDIGNAFVADCLENEIDSMASLAPSEKDHFKAYINLLEINRKKVDDYTNQLLSIQQMEHDAVLAAACQRTDIEVTEEMKTHDDGIMNDDSEWK